jgi:hypothetical protein
MTTSVPVSTVVAEPPSVGSIIYLASYMLRLALSAETTPSDTPDLYSGKLQVLGDPGDMSLDPLVGPQGYAGQAQFPLRLQDSPLVTSIADLPDYLTNTQTDIGKYWEIDILDFEGVVIDVQSWVWYGNSWRNIRMGSTGPPGALPEIQPSVEVLPAQAQPTYPDTTSFMETSGTRLEPSWIWNLAVPQGPPGPISPVYVWPDTDFTTIASYDVMWASGEYTDSGEMIWKPLSLSKFDTQFFSVPENAFHAYTGESQQAPIGNFTIPAQPFPWTPVVWGHIGEGGFMLSGAPFKVGCEVLLGDAAAGPMIARGFGTTMGEVNVMPHYSTPDNKNKSLTPTNNYAVVPAGQAATIYFNLWNDGQWGLYSFNPQSAQMFVLAMPMLQEPPTTAPLIPPITVVQTCNNSNPQFPNSITAGNAVVMLIGGASDGNPVTVHPPQIDVLSPFTPANTFAVWNNGTSGCLQSPAGNIDAGGYFLSAYVLPDCFTSNGVDVVIDHALAYGFTALEVSGLGTHPRVDNESHQGGGPTSTTYKSGVASTPVDEALILAECYSGGGIGNVPGAPWTTFTTASRGAGYQIQSTAGGIYSWNGALTNPESWIAGIAAIIGGQAPAPLSARKRRR